MREYKIKINNRTHHVVIKKVHKDSAIVEVNGKQIDIEIETKIKRHLEPLEVKPTHNSTEQIIPSGRKISKSSPSSDHQIFAPLPGLILQILVEEGEKISSNQIVMKMEAMKMENDIKSERDGIVEKIHVKQGDAVLENTVLISLGKG